MRDTIDMAREAGIIDFRDAFSEAHVQAVLQDLKAFEALVRADERSDSEGRFNALLDDYRTALETIGDMRSEDEVNGNIIQCLEATIKRLEEERKAEREACAKVCEAEAEMFKSCAYGANDGRYDWKEDGARECAASIRARGTHDL
jgi:uncharacterized protein YicC (UPF0701 family)